MGDIGLSMGDAHNSITNGMLEQDQQIVALGTVRKRDKLPPDSTEDAARGPAVCFGGRQVADDSRAGCQVCVPGPQRGE